MRVLPSGEGRGSYSLENAMRNSAFLESVECYADAARNFIALRPLICVCGALLVGLALGVMIG